MASLVSLACHRSHVGRASNRGDLLLSLVVVAGLLVCAGVGRERGERQQGAEEHRDSRPKHEQTKCL